MSLGWIEELKKYALKMKEDILIIYIAYTTFPLGLGVKIVTGLLLGLALSPIDIIPDFIPVLGYLDDLIIIPLGIRLVMWMIPFDVIEASRIKAREISMKNLKISRVIGVLIIIMWLLVLLYIVYTIIA